MEPLSITNNHLDLLRDKVNDVNSGVAVVALNTHDTQQAVLTLTETLAPIVEDIAFIQEGIEDVVLNTAETKASVDLVKTAVDTVAGHVDGIESGVSGVISSLSPLSGMATTMTTMTGLVYESLAAYKLTDIYDSGEETQYYGYADASENWYIKRVSATQIRYVKGSGSYSGNWTGRAGLTYQYFFEVF